MNIISYLKKILKNNIVSFDDFIELLNKKNFTLDLNSGKIYHSGIQMPEYFTRKQDIEVGKIKNKVIELYNFDYSFAKSSKVQEDEHQYLDIINGNSQFYSMLMVPYYKFTIHPLSINTKIKLKDFSFKKWNKWSGKFIQEVEYFSNIFEYEKELLNFLKMEYSNKFKIEEYMNCWQVNYLDEKIKKDILNFDKTKFSEQIGHDVIINRLNLSDKYFDKLFTKRLRFNELNKIKEFLDSEYENYKKYVMKNKMKRIKDL
jgi:hypothetical protein